MDEEEAIPEKVPLVIHIRRGDGRLNYRITRWEMVTQYVYQIAWRAAADFAYLQQSRGTTELIDPNSNKELGLKLPDKDRPLTGFLSLRAALEGHWQEMDAAQIGEHGLDESMSRAQVVTLDLVELR